jgi:hypothetical protein
MILPVVYLKGQSVLAGLQLWLLDHVARNAATLRAGTDAAGVKHRGVDAGPVPSCPSS